MIQVKIGTTQWKACPDGIAEPGYVTYDGEFVYAENGKTPLMVWDTDNVRHMTSVEIAAIPGQRLQALYSRAKSLLTEDDPISKKEKAVLLVILDEFNAHANKINAILSAIDGAASFGAMKTAIAGIADYPQRTASQIRTAVANKIDAGQADG
jgi:hypothetical protein